MKRRRSRSPRRNSHIDNDPEEFYEKKKQKFGVGGSVYRSWCVACVNDRCVRKNLQFKLLARVTDDIPLLKWIPHLAMKK